LPIILLIGNRLIINNNKMTEQKRLLSSRDKIIFNGKKYIVGDIIKRSGEFLYELLNQEETFFTNHKTLKDNYKLIRA